MTQSNHTSADLATYRLAQSEAADAAQLRSTAVARRCAVSTRASCYDCAAAAQVTSDHRLSGDGHTRCLRCALRRLAQLEIGSQHGIAARAWLASTTRSARVARSILRSAT
jgi:hypothetical protein